MAKAKEAAAAAEASEGTKGEGDAAAAPKKRFSKKTLMMAGGGLVLVLALGGGAAFFLMGGDSAPAHQEASHGDAHAGDAHADEGHKSEAAHGDKAQAHGGDAAHADGVAHPTFFDLPAILVNLRSQDKQSFLKLTVSLEVRNADAVKAIEGVMPRVVDQFQTFLRELRVEDLSGSEATFRLKEELLRRVNLAAAPARIEDVLFKEMIIQ